MLSIYGKSNDRVGLGGLVFNDQVGPTSRAGANLTYAYHINLSQRIKLSLALSGGFTQFKIDKENWNISNPDDPLMNGGEIVNLVPDATFGFNIYNEDNWYLGASVPQLLNSELILTDDNDNVTLDANLARHINVMGLYNVELNYYWDIQPSILFKSVLDQSQLDIGLKTIYNDNLWIGMDYRNNGDISALLGLFIQDRYIVGYSYDIPNTEISSYTSGSHEFMFGITFRPSTEKQIMR